ncbi:probable protein phosphatase 2C 25 [Aristolochia californica]|uniref:probable protein phosphatase 2C 25 n=1 Tax=Aristolochia californica TaxID=171875 RepID=UPI0035D727B7
MSCAVAVSGSPVFSPTRETLFCKIASSPKTLTLSGSPSSPSSSSSATSSLQSPSSSFRLRLQKQVGGIKVPKKEAGPVVESTSALLKRKRPARIDIPLSSLSFAQPLGTVPPEQKDVEIDTERFSVLCKKGRRSTMEDRHSAVVDIHGDPKQAFFGVFDGHGGTKAAEFAAENIDKNVMTEIMERGDTKVEEAVKCGYLKTDSEFLKEEVHGGTCCVTALIRNGDLVVSNAGDCRAVMSRGGTAEALTVDHRPSREDEKTRIQNLGGYVDNCRGVWRIQGSLAVSRGIGDSRLKQWVIAEPDTKVLRINPDCEFLILASDGLWDKVGNQEAVEMARPLCVGTNDPATLSACKKLVDLSVKRGSADDISVMIIHLGHFFAEQSLSTD